jgi:outer membrane lipoprotein-sorting protein
MGLVSGCGKGDSAMAPALPADATPEQRTIAQARAALGPEDKLNGVNTLVLAGSITDAKNQLMGQLVLMFKKPARQRMEMRAPDQTLKIEGSDGIEGWMVSVDKNNNKALSVLNGKDEMQNVYESIENLYFYRASERVRGSKVTLNGEAQYRNAACWKISFEYPNSMTYVRYFDRATGKLRGTVIEPLGQEFVEEGETTVDGIIFPSVLHSYDKDGKLINTLKFASIKVNAPMDDRLFATPTLMDLFSPAPKAAGSSGAASASPAKSTVSAASLNLPPSLPALKTN